MNLASLTPVQFRLFALPSGLYTIQQLLDLTGANTISYLFQNIRALYQCFTPPTNPDDQTTISIDQHPFQARLSMIEPVVPSQRQASLTLVQGQLRALAPGARTIRQLLDLTGALTISDLFHNIRVLDPSFVEPIDLNSRTIIGIGQHPFLAVVIDPRRGENGREPATQWQSRAPVQPIFERPTIQQIAVRLRGSASGDWTIGQILNMRIRDYTPSIPELMDAMRILDSGFVELPERNVDTVIRVRDTPEGTPTFRMLSPSRIGEMEREAMSQRQTREPDQPSYVVTRGTSMSPEPVLSSSTIPKRHYLLFEDAKAYLESGDASRFVIDPYNQRELPLGTVRITLIGIDGTEYDVIVKYDPMTNQIFPPYS